MSDYVRYNFAEKCVFVLVPDSSAFSLDKVEELIFEEVDFFVPHGLANTAPVLLVGVNELVRLQHFDLCTNNLTCMKHKMNHTYRRRSF